MRDADRITEALRARWAEHRSSYEARGATSSAFMARLDEAAASACAAARVVPPCAWCLPGRRWPYGVSHGICEEHAKAMREQSSDTCRSVVLESDPHREESST